MGAILCFLILLMGGISVGCLIEAAEECSRRGDLLGVWIGFGAAGCIFFVCVFAALGVLTR